MHAKMKRKIDTKWLKSFIFRFLTVAGTLSFHDNFVEGVNYQKISKILKLEISKLDARLISRNDDMKDELSRLREELSNVRDTVNSACTYLPEQLNSLRDCVRAKDGPNEILTTPGKLIMANCDDEWLVIAHRYNGHKHFERRTWDEYKHGFGVTPKEYFIGFESLLTILNRGNYMLRIDFLGWENERGFAQYSSFRIGDESSKYKLILAGYMRDFSTVRDRLEYFNGNPFSTKDVDNGGHGCMARYSSGPWWYGIQCGSANLFSTYDYNGPSCEDDACMYWHGFSHDLRIFTNRNYTIKEMKMKIKPFITGFPLYH